MMKNQSELAELIYEKLKKGDIKLNLIFNRKGVKNMTKKISLILIFVFVAIFFFSHTDFAFATGKSFNAHLKIVKSMLNKEQYNAMTNKYFEKQMMYGTYRSEYDLLGRNFIKNHYLKPNSFKVIYKTQMSVAQWDEHFTTVTAKKRGVVVAKVLDKTTKDVYVDINGNELVYIFQVTKQKGKVTIPAILNSTLNIVKEFNLVP